MKFSFLAANSSFSASFEAAFGYYECLERSTSKVDAVRMITQFWCTQKLPFPPPPIHVCPSGSSQLEGLKFETREKGV